MEKPIIEIVIKASEILKNCKLDLDKIQKEESIINLNGYFGTNTIETVLVVTVFQLSAESTQIDREDMAKYLDCNPILFFKYERNFKKLQQNKLLESNMQLMFSSFKRRLKYGISEELQNAIVDNKKFENAIPVSKTDPVELLTDLAKIIQDREKDKIDTYLVKGIFVEYILDHKEIPLFRNLRFINMTDTEKMWFVLMINHNLNGKLTVYIDEMGDTLFSNAADKINFVNTLHDKTNALIMSKWISYSSGGYFNTARVELTPKTQEFLKPLGIHIRLDVLESRDHLISPDKVHKKKLFYNSDEAEQIETVANSLKLRNHAKIKKRLTAQGLRTGICTLMYGASGTGKTESVYQIAKQTGRPVWKVDLSELKSMWFGESQKKVKGLFNSYKDLCKDEKRTPILLLNEADAVLGKRQINNNSSTQTTENAIQNIFLDCLEDFEGILFATTNMEQSLDPAFERRFLFKIKFNRPKPLAQQKIWKATLPVLTKSQAKFLSETYSLSGGEIENVFRKLAMRRVLEEEVEIFDTVKILCKNEQLALKGKMHAIGYLKN